MANKIKVVVRLSGGLGNQLHQYAYGSYLANKFSAKLLVDTSFYKLDPERLQITRRSYELHNLMIDAEEFKSFLSNYTLLKVLSKFPLIRKVISKLFKITLVEKRIPEDETAVEGMLYYLNGVFGTANEYLQIADKLQQEFSPAPSVKNYLPVIESNNENRVAIHIRRTDYLKAESVHEVLPFTYYTRAIEYIKSKVINPAFYIFGDDEKWIKENFDLTKTEFKFTNLKEDYAHLSDFFSIIHCQHCIISNSTFAWWAAFLNTNDQKIVVAPGIWLKDKPLNFKETYLTNWHVI